MTALTVVRWVWEYWDGRLAQLYKTLPQLSQTEFPDNEPITMFWQCMMFFPINEFAPYNRIPQGTIILTLEEAKREAGQWLDELIELPFYQAINAFTQAFKEWLETCDLQPLRHSGKSELQIMNNCLRFFEVYV